ncbi:MAG: MbnP family protein [Chitinophagales bacterium]
MLKQLSIISILTLFFFSACEKDPPVPSDPEVELNFTAKAGGDDLVLREIYTANSGHQYQINTFKFYLNNIRFTNTEGEVHLYKDIAILNFSNGHSESPVVPEQLIATLPEGNYTKMSFDIGVDPERNKQDPAQYERDHPLSIYQSMHWSWNTGYIFLMLEGETDSVVGNNSLDKTLLCHIGTDKLLKTVSLDVQLKPVKGEQNIEKVNIAIDMNDVFSGPAGTVDLPNTFTQTTESEQAFVQAEQVADNFAAAFYLLE